MMKTKLTQLAAVGALLIAVCLIATSGAVAQIIPDSIFDKPPEAFGNTIQDVPPDILAVEAYPESPKADEPVRVMANIKVDSDISKFYVNEAFLYYRAAGAPELTRIRMERMPDRPKWWSATLPGFPAGTDVEYFIRGVDKIGNEVIQLPANEKTTHGNTIEIMLDGEDRQLPATMDIVSTRVGYTGKELVVCPKTKLRFQQFSALGAGGLVVGFISDDVRVHPTQSHTENTAGFMGYIPAIGLKGIITVDQLSGTSKSNNDDSTAQTFGKFVCMSAKVEKLTPTPDRGLKIYAATAGINALTTELNLGDATPYALVYFKGGKYKVGNAVP